MTTRRYAEIDVFTAEPLLGNPLAVIIDSEGLDGARMQHIANWLNFSETTFLLPPTTPQADYRVRIFTPRQELPFAGHPSVGSAYVAMTSGRVRADARTLVQECAAGLLPVRVEGEDSQRKIHVRAPEATRNALSEADADALAQALGARFVRPPGNVCNGPNWLTCDLGESPAVRALRPDMITLASITDRLGAVGACVFGRTLDGIADMAVRAFCPADGIPEDPVTGSANAAIAHDLFAHDGLQAYGRRYRASQGREVGRDGSVEIEVDADGKIHVGGACTLVVQGTLHVD
ncbi:PhzF family phenazine biosynthesis protein [Oleiagrimonas sp.]|jgi:PhzF family phenazine biosynthesis protein|uniref:PhzF family phenazine biosynthesis protein n=1 Tax=Oleiagrimonas sp. TaxID=2010330 RepID=UPI00263420E8|nr:PhzF family phenazine biosynthesis protein [Oleiagrimonas sp.]MDA3915047.1 PhzF family phenazine biosynthesis protein [Oleiagrimonas sp.]